MKRLVLAFQFLTILPIRTKTPVAEDDIPKSASFFVIVGFVQGILLVGTDYICGMLFHPDLVTGLILLVLVLSNGGFHLDGLADTFDAIAAKSEGNTEKDRQKRLAIMKDSATGAIGVTAIFFALLLKYLSLKNISHFSFFAYYSTLLLMPVVSKWAMVMAMFHGRPARADGLGKLFIGRIRTGSIVISTLVFILALILPSLLLGRYTPSSRYIFYVVMPLAIYVLCRIWVSFSSKKFGGLTGDVVGALSEMSETIFLLMVIAWSRLSI